MFAVWIVFYVIACLIFPCVLRADHPLPWQVGFQDPATSVMQLISDSYDLVMIIMLATVVVVFLLLFYVVFRFRRKRDEKVKFNSDDSKVVVIEVLWTVVPLLIVGFLAISNIKVLREERNIPESEFTIKAIGYQWYWNYTYPEKGNINFDSYIKGDDDLKSGEFRLLEVDNRVIVPINTNVRVQVTSADVIHSWAVPSLGIKIDAIPGRLNETWFNIKRVGVYYGQCSELCGRLHGFMPIAIQAVDREDFELWLKGKVT